MKKTNTSTPLLTLVAFVGISSAPLSAATVWTGGANDGDLFGTSANWDNGSPGSTASDVGTINNGDTVTLGTDYTAPNTYNLVVGGNSTLNASADFTATGLVIQNTGTVNLTGGAFTLPKTSTNNNGQGSDGTLNIQTGGTLSISGGTHVFNERTTMNGTFQVVGSSANITMHQIGGGTGNFDFVFDSSGVSGIVGAGGFPWFSISNNTVTVDGSAFTGGTGSFTLFDCDDSGGMFGEDSVVVTGLGEKGVGWELIITDNPAGSLRDTVVLNVIPESGSYALIGGLLTVLLVGAHRRR